MSDFTVLKVNDLDTLLHVIASYGRTVVDFSAPSWCIPCKRFMPHFHAAAEKAPAGTQFVEVDIDQAPEIQSHFNIMSVPTVLMFSGSEHNPVALEGRFAAKLLREIGVVND